MACMSIEDLVDELKVEETLDLKIKKKKRSKKKNSTTDAVDINSGFHESRLNLISIKCTKAKGRCLTATDHIMEGQCIYREVSNCVIADRYICCSCNRKCRTEPLGDEMHPYLFYCSSSCMELFRWQRDFEIPIASRLAHIAATCLADVKLLQMIVRVLSWASKQRENSRFNFFTDDGKLLTSTYNGFLTLESHLELQGSAWITSIQRAIEMIIPLLPVHDEVWKVQEILEIAARINTNAYGLSDDNSVIQGFGVFPVIGMTVNHSCYPNCCYVFMDGEMQCRSIRNIAKGEELTVTYIDILDTYHRRKANLLTTRFFECNCLRCCSFLSRSSQAAAETELLDTSVSSGYQDALLGALFCLTCGLSSFVEDTVDGVSFSCSTCGHKIEVADARRLLEDAENALNVALTESLAWQILDPMKSITALEKWITNFQGKPKASQSQTTIASRKYHGARLHTSNRLVLKACMTLSDMLESSDIMKSITLLKQAIEIITLILPENYPELISLRCRLARRMDSFLSSRHTIPHKAKHQMMKEKNELLEKIRNNKRIAYGEV